METQSDAERDTIDRDEVARKNNDAMVRLMNEHNLFVPARTFPNWRPTVRTNGMVDGFYKEDSPFAVMTCIATDGILAYFLLADGSTWIGHIHNFRWSEPVVSMVPYIDEHGQQRFFKSVKDHGAPKALFSKPTKPRVKASPKPKMLTEKQKRKKMLEEI